MRRAAVLTIATSCAALSACSLVLGLSDHELETADASDATIDQASAIDAPIDSSIDATVDAGDAATTFDATADSASVDSATDAGSLDAAIDALAPLDAAVPTYSQDAAVTLATDLGEPAVLIAYGNTLYFADSNFEINSVPKAGGDLDSIVTTLAATVDIATDGTYVYFPTPNAPAVDAGADAAAFACQIGRASIASRAMDCLAAIPDSRYANRLTLDRGGVWFTSFWYPGFQAEAFYHVTTNGMVTDLGDYVDTFGPLISDGAFVFIGDAYPSSGSPPWAIHEFIVASNAFSSNYEFAVQANVAAIDITEDSNNVYWLNANGIYAIARSTPGGTPQFVCGATSGSRLAIDSEYLYLTVTSSGQIQRCAKAADGGAPTTLVQGEDGPFGIVVDDANMYWTNEGDGRIRAIGKPP
jgi:hypothetical protein